MAQNKPNREEYLKRAMVVRKKNVVDLGSRRKVEIKQNNPFYGKYLELKARREAGLPLFPVADKNEPGCLDMGYTKPPVFAIHDKCGHELDGAVKWTRGEMQYSTTSGGYKSSLAPCPHCTEDQHRIHAERVIHSRLNDESKIPDYTHNCTWETFPSNMDVNARDEIRDETLDSIASMRSGGRGTNLFIWGKPQGGKTTLTALSAREFMQAEIGVYFTSIRRYIRDLQEAMHNQEAQERNIEEIVLNAPVLILDDLGAEDGNATNGKKYISDWAIGKIFDLVEERLSRGLTTYITSNNSPAGLRDKWQSPSTEVQDQAGRIYARIKKYYRDIEVTKLTKDE